jgi:hypothetical protein
LSHWMSCSIGVFKRFERTHWMGIREHIFFVEQTVGVGM